MTDPFMPQQPASPQAQAAQVPQYPAAPEAPAAPQVPTPPDATQQNSSGEPRHAAPDAPPERMTPLFSPPGPLFRGVDAAYPGAALPTGTRILAAYIGIPGRGNASPDTPHIWAPAEWNHYVELHPELRLLPMYVHNYADGQPEVDAANAVASAIELGWSPGLRGEADRIIVIDVETLVDYEYFLAMGEAIQRGGFRPVIYGSASTVRGNPPFGGYFMAEWSGTHAPTALSPGVLGLQWRPAQPGVPWDLSVFSQDLYFGCGHGLRRG